MRRLSWVLAALTALFVGIGLGCKFDSSGVGPVVPLPPDGRPQPPRPDSYVPPPPPDGYPPPPDTYRPPPPDVFRPPPDTFQPPPDQGLPPDTTADSKPMKPAEKACRALFGGVPGFVFCNALGDSCRFYMKSEFDSCAYWCAQSGWTCAQACEEGGGLFCNCIAPATCTVVAKDHICTCSP